LRNLVPQTSQLFDVKRYFL